MIKRIPAGFAKLVAVALMATGCLAITAGAASATPEVAYNNLNTVPAMVNGLPNTDTSSFDYENFPVGSELELAKTNRRVIKRVATQLDVFACEHGVYNLECITLKPNKKFAMTWTASIHAVGPGNTVGAVIASSTETFKLRFRPSTNVTCPSTPEGKGYGANCDIGFLNAITFKHFTPKAVLPEKVIILLENSCGGCSGVPVNVGTETSFLEFDGVNFLHVPPANGGVAAVGSTLLPEGIYINGLLEEEPGNTGFHPVFKVEVAGQ